MARQLARNKELRDVLASMRSQADGIRRTHADGQVQGMFYLVWLTLENTIELLDSPGASNARISEQIRFLDFLLGMIGSHIGAEELLSGAAVPKPIFDLLSAFARYPILRESGGPGTNRALFASTTKAVGEALIGSTDR
jgi:transposase